MLYARASASRAPAKSTGAKVSEKLNLSGSASLEYSFFLTANSTTSALHICVARSRGQVRVRAWLAWEQAESAGISVATKTMPLAPAPRLTSSNSHTSFVSAMDIDSPLLA